MAVALLLALAAALTLPGLWRETQRREASLPQLEAEAARAPGDGPLLALVGAGRMAAGENAAAADALRQAIAAGESNADTWEALAASVAASGDRRRALADLHLGLAALPSSAALQGALAQARVTDAAAPPAALAAAIDPSGPLPLRARYAAGSALNGLAEWWGHERPASSGVETRRAWAAAQPANAQAQRLWGEALVRDRRVAEAVPVLRLASTLAPNSPACRLDLADALRSGGHLQDAALEYIAALHLRPDWAPALMGLGAAFQSSGLPGYAINSYRRATQVAPRSADAWVGFGTVEHQNDGGVVESVTAFETAARLAPDRIDYLDDYADVLRQANRWDDAEAVLRRRLAAVPGDAYGHFVLGTVLMDSKPTPAREAEAEANLRESLRLSPRNPVAEVSMAELLLDQGKASEARGLLLDSLRRLPYERRTILLLSRAYRLTGQNALAAQTARLAAAFQHDEDQANVMESATRAHQADIPFHQRLAALYDRIGKPDKAAKERLTIQRLQSGPQKVLHTQQELEDALNAVLSPH